MTEHTHSHSHGISHEEIATLAASHFHKDMAAIKAQSYSDLETALEESWSEYVSAKRKVVFYSSEQALAIVKNFVPNAAYLVIYEDNSHDAPHGHLEVILDESMHEIALDEDWHDLDWSHEIDELVWDIYTLAKEYFTLVGGKRRLLLGV